MRPLILSALLLTSLPAMGQTSAGNLPPDFYPQPKCEKPQSPGQVPESTNQPAVQAYNARAKLFNTQAETFNACMKDYSARAQKDIDAILATVHAAVAAANAPP